MVKNKMTTINYKKGDIVFVVEIDNTIIGVINEIETNMGVIGLEPLYMRRPINTNKVYIKPSNIKVHFGTNIEEVLREYSEYFI